jgi:hypothetical protein
MDIREPDKQSYGLSCGVMAGLLMAVEARAIEAPFWGCSLDGR